MTAGNEAWIQDSLGRLEQLESQREQLAASGRTDLLAELDEEIQSLYEALEGAADDGQGSAPANSPQWSAAPQHPAYGPTPVPVVSQLAAAPLPFAPAPAAFAPDPFAHAPMQQPMPQPAMAPVVDYGSASMDDDVSSGGKGAIIAVALVVLVGLGGGGWWFMARSAPEAPKPTAPVGEAKVIGVGEIPPDTQDPNVAKGGDADRTPAQIIKERAEQQDRRQTSRPSSGSSGPSRPREPDKPTRGPIKVGSSDDPLAGVK